MKLTSMLISMLKEVIVNIKKLLTICGHLWQHHNVIIHQYSLKANIS